MIYSDDKMISTSFTEGWNEDQNQPAARVVPEPIFSVPHCYHIDSSKLEPIKSRIPKLTDDALFYIFYTMPRDVLQEAAAAELQNRNWRFHKLLKLWLTKDPLSEPIPKNNNAEQGTYIFFDPYTWERVKKDLLLFYSAVA